MKHSSIKLPTPCEFINVTPLNPLISKCQIKVCYVGEYPNRNKTIITKELATQMANSLPGSPIVGFYNEEIQDFEAHEKELVIKNGTLQLKSKTRPYGFVDLNAKVWFQKFLDDGIEEREYLMTEGYLWTGQYPECQRVIDKGNNHSMELDEKKTVGHWTKDSNGIKQFFIINETIFSKLCILGEYAEPCFEGSSISVDFSLDEDFKDSLEKMIYQLQEFVDKGGKQTVDNELEFDKKKEEGQEKKVAQNEEEEKKDKTDKEETSKNENKTEDDSKEQEKETKEKKEDEEEEKKKDKQTKYEQTCPKCGKPVSECSCKKEYSLEEIPEYVELKQEYEKITSEFEAQKAEIEKLQSFKAEVERQAKKDMIDSFYMLSDKDKKDVVDKIDEYSLDDIEAKLSVLCVRNKVNFNVEEESKQEEKGSTAYDLNDIGNNEQIPAWAKKVIACQNN